MTPIQTSIQPQQALIVDHFAGGGGASAGIELALGRGPDIAINHDAMAIQTHEANHPQARHYRDDIWNVDPHEAVAGRPVSLLWTSPSCTHHSAAKGGGPLSEQLRALPWTAVRWAELTRPAVIITENVAEMATWGPLGPGGTPDQSRRGETYQAWLQALRDLGYAVEQRVLDAADYGAPTHRRRLFVVARRDGLSAGWPEPTHGPGRAQPWVPVSAVLDLDDLGEPAHARRRPLGPTTLGKIERALSELGEDVTTALGTRRVALMQYNGTTLGRPISRPLGTLTTVERYGLITRLPGGQTHYRMLHVREMAAAQGFPADYVLPDHKGTAVKLIGNSVSPLVAAAVVRAVMATPVQQAA